MKKLITFIFISLIGVSLFGLDIFNYVPLTGNVESYTQTDFTITSKFGDLFRIPNAKIVHIFDLDDEGNGREVDCVEMTPRDAFVNRASNIYDEEGNIIEVDFYDASMTMVWKNVITYNNDNQKADLSEYSKNGVLKSKTIYSYSDGNLVDESGYDGDGALVWKVIYRYTDDKLASVSQYAGDGSLNSEENYSYSDDGKIESILVFDHFAKKIEQKVFRYASNGSLSEITTYDENKQIKVRDVIKYDNSGKVARLSTYNVGFKFGSIVNELAAMSEFVYNDETSTRVASNLISVVSTTNAVKDAK